MGKIDGFLIKRIAGQNAPFIKALQEFLASYNIKSEIEVKEMAVMLDSHLEYEKETTYTFQGKDFVLTRL